MLKKAGLVCGIVLFLVVSGVGWLVGSGRQVLPGAGGGEGRCGAEEAVEAYVVNLVRGNVSEASKYAAGGVPLQYGSLMRGNGGAKDVSVTTKVLVASAKYAVVDGVVEVLLNDESVSLTWQRFHLVNDGDWKVCRIESLMPFVGEKQAGLTNEDAEAAASLVREYLSALANRKEFDTRAIFAGPLEQAVRENLKSVLDAEGASNIKPEEVKLEPLLVTDRGMVCRVSYGYGEGEAKVLATFYKTRVGMRVVDFSASG